MQGTKEDSIKVKVTISGSFRRDPKGLIEIYDGLRSAGCNILSPPSATPMEYRKIGYGDFVFMEGDSPHVYGPLEIERAHIAAIKESNFLWLHAPDGYVGVSAAMEIGYATALGIPIYTTDTVSDPIIQDAVWRVGKLKVGSYTGVVILDDKDNFLTLHFSQKQENNWRFAGGKVDPGETVLIAAARELKEELGVEATEMKLVDVHTHAVDGGIWVGYYFLVSSSVGQLRIMEPHKHDALMYLSPERLEELGAYPEAQIARKVKKLIYGED